MMPTTAPPTHVPISPKAVSGVMISAASGVNVACDQAVRGVSLLWIGTFRVIITSFNVACRYLPGLSPTWPKTMRHFQLFLITQLHLEVETVCYIIWRRRLRILRNFTRKSDFNAMCLNDLRFGRFTTMWCLFLGLVTVTPALRDYVIASDYLDEYSDLQFSYVGGSRTLTIDYKALSPHVIQPVNPMYSDDTRFTYIEQLSQDLAVTQYSDSKDLVYVNLPMHVLIGALNKIHIKNVAKVHGVYLPNRFNLSDVPSRFADHQCDACSTKVSVFAKHGVASDSQRSKSHYQKSDGAAAKKAIRGNAEKSDVKATKKPRKSRARDTKEKLANSKKKTKSLPIVTPEPTFPPDPPSQELKERIIGDCCKDMSPSSFEEAGCAVCGQLTPASKLSDLSDTKSDLTHLTRRGMGITRKERTSCDDPICELPGPILDKTCNKICGECEKSLMKGVIPTYALAKGLWIGPIPKQLKDLTFAERLLIARARHSKFIVRVSSGMYKMKSNAVVFENPTPKIYQTLPPAKAELDDVLAFIFTGPCRPSPEDMERTPLLVRRQKVTAALEWLKLNHMDYYDLDISYKNLAEYPDSGIPVVVAFREEKLNRPAETVSAIDNDEEEGVTEGPCPFVVNGMFGESLETSGNESLKLKAAKHLEEGGGVLAISHSKNPLSVYHNPKLYPMMFPHLFPYGLGGIGSINGDILNVSSMMHKRRLLMYHDKRFQTEAYFPLIAFNHEQIKKATTGGYLLTERHNFDNIADRLMNIDTAVLTDLSKRLSKGERVKPETDEEKACYALISDLDHVGGKVQGSVTSKKYMRNEIWSLIAYKGAPSWFITFAPADVNSPICLYFADTKTKFSPRLRSDRECYSLIASNPVAGARYFHFVVEMFIKHVLGVDQKHPGLYGETSAYYGTVEQQGRLTLHLHLLLWIRGSLTPQEIRDRIMDPSSDFQKKIVEYLESLCVGGFIDSDVSEVSVSVKKEEKDNSAYEKPTLTLPEAPPKCRRSCNECESKLTWRRKFKTTVNDLLLRSNIHKHDKLDKDGVNVSYCMNSKGECKRRFPRDVSEQTMVDPHSGALNMKKSEPMMNTVTPELTYVLRSNSDVTSLLSGTAIKAIVAYVTDYITKQALKTYSIFDVVRSVIDRNSELIGGDSSQKEKVRKLFTQVVNSLTTKMEIGAPMASMYVLGNPDHYTSHTFKAFYWRPYAKEVVDAWQEDSEKKDGDGIIDCAPEKVVLQKRRDGYIGISKVDDYKYRPVVHEKMSLYDWVRLSDKAPKVRSRKKKIGDAADDPEFDDEDDNLINSKHAAHPLPNESDDVVSDIKLDNDRNDVVGDDRIALPPLSTLEEETEIELTGNELLRRQLAGEIQSDEEEIDEFDEDALDSKEEEELLAQPERSDQAKEDRSFLDGHPQARTHAATIKEDNGTVIPNFIPSTLPRSDRGDREYYCCTMLTLFKPWRSGRDLKKNDESWDKAFHEHRFTDRQKEIMKYFGVRYECLDARDDYSAKREKDYSESIKFPWASSDNLRALDDMNHDNSMITSADYDNKSRGDYADVIDEKRAGKKFLSRLGNMQSAENIMRTSGVA